MTLKNSLLNEGKYSIPGFEFFEPIARSDHSVLGLYNDDRFPGRSILASTENVQSLTELSMDTMLGFMRDLQIAMEAIKRSSGATRVNVAFLSNREPHLHAHLIPRFPEREEFPDCSPWNDRRPKGVLADSEVQVLKQRIFQNIVRFDTRSSKSLNEDPTLFEVNLSR